MTKPGRTFLLLFALAFAVRLAAGLWTGMSREPVEDERGYVEMAERVSGARYDKYIDADLPRSDRFKMVRWVGGSPFDRRSFRGPVAPILFAPVGGFGGGVAWMRLVAILCGALGPPLLFLALRRSPLGDRAWWPAAAYALWPPAIYVSVRALSEAPSQAFLLGSVAVLAAPKSRHAAWSGLLSGLAILARPSALLSAGLLAFAAGKWRRILVFGLVLFLVVDVWVARNWHLHGRALLTTNSGVTLVGGNSQAAADAEPPGKWVAPERVYANAADPPDLGMWGWSSLTEEASDRRFAKDAVTWVRENPGAAARLACWKVVRLFDPDPHSEKDDAAGKAWIGWLTFGPVLLLAVLGHSAWRAEMPWTLMLVGTVATAVVFYGDTRMRTCADPALLVFAAHGALRVVARLRARDVH